MRTKNIPLEDIHYEIRRFTPAVGSYIWQLLMRAIFKAGEAQKPGGDEPIAEGKERTPEEKLRGVCAIAFMHLEFSDFEFIQNASFKVLSRIESGAPMPFMTMEGRWDPKLYEHIDTNPMLATQLVTETLVFNLTSFLG